jgi:hypothetical protein
MLQFTLPPPATVAKNVCTAPMGIVAEEGLIDTLPGSAVTVSATLFDGPPTGAGFVTITG